MSVTSVLLLMYKKLIGKLSKFLMGNSFRDGFMFNSNLRKNMRRFPLAYREGEKGDGGCAMKR